MSRPVYHHPEFVVDTKDERTIVKRYWLILTIDKTKKESIVVILKNPSRATKDISDKTVYTVTKYIYNKRKKYKQLKNVGSIIILNLIPFYETYSHKLSVLDKSVIDKKNIQTIADYTRKNKNVIIAWGNAPKDLHKEYEIIKKEHLG